MGGAAPADRVRVGGASGSGSWSPWRRALLGVTATLLPVGYVLAAGVPLALAWLAECVARRRSPWERTPLDALLVAWVSWVSLSALTSPHRDLALGNTLLLVLGALCGLAPLACTLRERPEFRRWLYAAWVAGGAFAGAWTLARFLAGLPRGELPQLGYNAVGTMLAAASVLGLGLVGAGDHRVSAFGAAAQLPVLAGLLATLSRGAWIGWGVGVLCLVPWLGVRTRSAVFAAVAVLMLSLAAHPGLRDRARSTMQPERNQDRLLLWRASVRMVADHPWLGVGFGAFAREYPDYRLPQDPNVAPPFAHNILLSLAVETGLPGAAVFAGLLAYALWVGARSATRAPPRHGFLQGVGLAALVAVMAHQMVDGTLQSFHLGFAFWFLLACILPERGTEGKP